MWVVAIVIYIILKCQPKSKYMVMPKASKRMRIEIPKSDQAGAHRESYFPPIKVLKEDRKWTISLHGLTT